MNIPLLLRTIKQLRPVQLLFQIRYRLVKPRYIPVMAPEGTRHYMSVDSIPKYKCCDGIEFEFLNKRALFNGWNEISNGALWCYNQNYFDWLNQEGMSDEEGCKWIDRYMTDIMTVGIGLDSYPTALRCINWVKFFCRFPNSITKPRIDSLYSQLRLLERKLEYHLLGNHILEDSYALYIGASFFNDEILLNKSEKLLLSQLKEQVLPDGAHYEQSPMYHCILLDRLLDCINFRKTNALISYAKKMLGHLESITWRDGTTPMLNDSAIGIAPAPKQIFDYAVRLGLKWERIPLNESGYRSLSNDGIEAIIDVGNITATYQPGHSHADTFNFELRIDGRPFVVDTGISTYDKSERRQLERSTLAHNCVSVNGKNTSEVWGGFRVGKRCHCIITRDTGVLVEARHNGLDKTCRRVFEMKDGALSIMDWYDGEAISYIHLAEGADETRIKINSALSIDIKPWKYSIEYNKFLKGKVIEIRFKGRCSYSIQ